MMNIEKREGYHLWIGGPVPPGADAWTINSLIIVRKDKADSERLLSHELVHVEQFKRHGFFGFIVRYYWNYLKLRLKGKKHKEAYRLIPFEVEAYERQNKEGNENYEK